MLIKLTNVRNRLRIYGLLLFVLLIGFTILQIFYVKDYLDTTFDVDGKLTTDIGAFEDVGTSVLVQPDGKIVVAGWTTREKSDYDYLIVDSGAPLNGTGGGNRGFDFSFNSTNTTIFTGTDKVDHGYGYFPVTILSGNKYAVTAKISVLNGTALNIITSNGTNFATDQVQKVIDWPVSGTYEFTATENASHIGFGSLNISGFLSLSVSDFKVEEIRALITVPVDIAVNGTGGGNRSFETLFRVQNSNEFLGADENNQGYGYFPVEIRRGKKYKVTSTIGVSNGSPKSMITSSGTNFFTDTVQVVTTSMASGSIEFVAIDDASFIGYGSVYRSDLMSMTVSNFKVEEIVKPIEIQNHRDYSRLLKTDFVIVRYNKDGGLDTSFNRNGIVITEVSAGNDQICNVGLQEDWKIVVVGTSATAAGRDIVVARYNTDGTLDTMFGPGGFISTGVGVGNGLGCNLVLRSDGKIVVLGNFHNGIDFDTAIVQYNENGTLDSTFGLAGLVTIATGHNDEKAYDTLIQADGKIIVIGLSNNEEGTYYFTAVRYDIDGRLDTDYGNNGKVMTLIEPVNHPQKLNRGYDKAASAVIQPDGKLVIAGDLSTGFSMVRYTASGRHDASFGDDGIVRTSVGLGGSKATGIALQKDGKIVVTGKLIDVFTGLDIALVQYDKDGTLDTSFGRRNISFADIDSAYDVANDIELQPDGKAIVVGYSMMSSFEIAVYRFNKMPFGDPIYNSLLGLIISIFLLLIIEILVALIPIYRLRQKS